MPALILAGLAWGALAFGAVYPWGWVPLALACATVGLSGMVRQMPDVYLRWNPALTLSLVAVVIAIALQLVPVAQPVAASAGIEPVADTSPTAVYPLSIDSRSTAIALGLFLAFAVALIGCARGLAARDLRALLAGLTVLGALVALVALFQRLSASDALYGFWTPAGKNIRLHAGGPFINRNHLAGWLLMTLSTTLGWFIGQAARVADEAPVGWRDRVLWLSSPDAARTMLTGTAALLMATALVQTLSRSGLAGFLVALVLTLATVVRVRWPRWRRSLIAASIALVAMFALALTGLGAIEARMNESGVSYTDRVLAWQNTLRIVRDAPLVGTGLGTYGVAMLRYQATDPRVRFEEAHNDYLQLLAEGGLLVVVPSAVLLLVFVREARRRFRNDSHDPIVYWARVGAVTGLIAIACQETVEFSLQIPGNVALLVVLMAIAAGRLPHRDGFEPAPTHVAR